MKHIILMLAGIAGDMMCLALITALLIRNRNNFKRGDR